MNIKKLITPAFNTGLSDIHDTLFNSKNDMVATFHLNANPNVFNQHRGLYSYHDNPVNQFGLYTRAHIMPFTRGSFIAVLEPHPERIDVLLTRYSDTGFAMVDEDFNIVEYNRDFYLMTRAHERKKNIKGVPLSRFIMEKDWKNFHSQRKSWQRHLLQVSQNSSDSWQPCVNAFNDTPGTEEWKVFHPHAWHMGGRELACRNPEGTQQFIMLNKVIAHHSLDMQITFDFKTSNINGLGVFFNGLKNFVDTPDEGGFLVIFHGRHIHLKENCNHAAITAGPELSHSQWHRLCIEKVGSMISLSIDKKRVLRNYELSPVLPNEQQYFGFFASHPVVFRHLLLQSRTSRVNLDLYPPRVSDVRFKRLPDRIYQMKIHKRLLGHTTMNGALFMNVTDLREKEQALEKSEHEIEMLSRENVLLRDEVFSQEKWIKSKNPKMEKIYNTISEVAPLQVGVLLEGETGTGKEMLAQMIHKLSQRAKGPFIKVDCAALPETLLESELFGHERGAFTGAHERRIGRFELAHQGTLFLDEIGNISPAIQVKLLRVLQDKCFERLGSTTTTSSDFRIICATNQDLEKAVRENRFRRDLYYRINIVKLNLPPLRERIEDIPLFAYNFVKECASRNKKSVYNISNKAIGVLRKYPWPGNIRELKNMMESSVILAAGTRLEVSDLQPLLTGAAGDRQPSPETGKTMVSKRQIITALRKHRGNAARTAASLSLKPSRLYYLLKVMNINPAHYRLSAKTKDQYEAAIIHFLQKKGGRSIRDINRTLSIAPSVIKKVLDILVERQIVQKIEDSKNGDIYTLIIATMVSP